MFIAGIELFFGLVAGAVLLLIGVIVFKAISGTLVEKPKTTPQPYDWPGPSKFSERPTIKD